MKANLSILSLLFSLFNIVPGNTQCPVPNNDFHGYWIASTLLNQVDLFDPQSWTSNWRSNQNALDYYESGIYPAKGSDGTNGAVVFDLIGPLTETGIRTLDPIVCNDFPIAVSGHFKHLSVNRDTLAFILHFTSVDAGGNISHETPTAFLVCNTLEHVDFKAFKIDMPLPQGNVYTQIDSVSIVYKSKSSSAGTFILDDFSFEYAASTGASQAWTQNIRVLPTVTRQMVSVTLPEQMPGLQLRVFDTTGKTLFECSAGSTETVAIDLGRSPAGIYFIEGRLAGESGRFWQKIVRH